MAGPSRRRVTEQTASQAQQAAARPTGRRREAPILRLWRHARGHRGRIVWAASCSVLNKIFDLAPPALIGMAVDVVVRREDSLLAGFGVTDTRDQLLALAALTFLIWGLESLFEYLYAVAWRNLAQTIQHGLRLEAYDHVQHLDLSFFESQSTGALMAVLNDDINQLERFLDVGANDLLQVATTVVVIGAAFFALAPEVAWMAFLPIPVILWGSFRYQRRLAPRYASVREKVGLLNAQLGGNLQGIATIKAFVAEAIEAERIRGLSEAYRAANRRAIRLSSAFVPLIRIAILVGFTATLVFGGFMALDGSLEVGAYSVMVFMTQRLLWPLTRLGATVDLYQRAMASTERVLDLLEVQPEVESGPRRLPRDEVRGRISLEGVSFAYRAGLPVLRGIDLVAEAGQTTAVVGPTGSGKTTLVKLLFRFYDPDEGVVRLDGVDLRDFDLADLRRAMGLVSQDVFLFHGTVRENIAYGRPDASFEEIVEAAKAAEAHAFIEALPEGYDTVVGERGQKLSGGQRQRISIARAVLADPPILVLDEATSAVDNETEAAIQRSLARVASGRTTLVIAHRLSTIRHADRIYVLDQGQVREMGTHDTLLAAGGLYATLWRVQTGEQEARGGTAPPPRTEPGEAGARAIASRE
ncbi:MAG: ABC transporter ATP-binding protein [Deltaproteobacteria bacterium]|nr:MAG: ABC transporter ATP-binding protein [Deltaproteobacteria bacterium]